MRIFKSEVKQMHEDDPKPKPTTPVEGRIVEPPAAPRDTPPADARSGEQHDTSA
jgi:hypothetical protein